MMSKLASLSVGMKASIVYVAATLLSRGLTIITMPIFTRLMSPADIGLVNIYTSWSALLGGAVALSLTSGGFQVALHKFKEERDEYLSSMVSLTSLSACICLCIYLYNYKVFNLYSGLSTEMSIMMLTGFIIQPAFDFWLARQRYEYNFKSVGVITIVSSVLTAAISVCAIIFANQNSMEGLGEIRLVAGNVIPYLLAAIIWGKLLLNGKVLYNRKFWIFSLSLSIPMLGNTIASQVLSVSDRIMISNFVDNFAVGIYGTLYSISSISTIVWGAINSSFVPYLFENINSVEQQKSIKQISAKLLLFFACAVIVISLIAPEMVMILATEEYFEAVYIVPPIIAGVYFISISNMFSNVLLYHECSKYIMVASVIAALVNIVLNYITIPLWGYMSAAYTTLASYMLLALIQAIISTKVHRECVNNMQASVYDNNALLKISILAVVGCMLCVLLYEHNVIRYSVFLVFFIVLLGFKDKVIDIIKFKKEG